MWWEAITLIVFIAYVEKYFTFVAVFIVALDRALKCWTVTPSSQNKSANVETSTKFSGLKTKVALCYGLHSITIDHFAEVTTEDLVVGPLSLSLSLFLLEMSSLSDVQKVMYPCNSASLYDFEVSSIWRPERKDDSW